MVKVLVSLYEQIVSGSLHPGDDGISISRSAVWLTGSDDPNTIWVLLAIRDRNSFRVVNEQRFIGFPELGGQLPTVIGPLRRRNKDARWWLSTHLKREW